MIEVPVWFSSAKCSGMTELFFTPSHSENSKTKRRREAAAIAICNSCPSMLLCREYARKNSELGIWGGETEDMRWKAGVVPPNSALKRRRSPDYYKNYKEKLKAKKLSLALQNSPEHV